MDKYEIIKELVLNYCDKRSCYDCKFIGEHCGLSQLLIEISREEVKNGSL